MIRIACIGDYTVRYSHFTAGVMEGAIRLGHWFRPIPLLQPIAEIAKQVDYFRPDIIFIHQIFSAYHEIRLAKQFLKDLRAKGIKVLLHEGDWRPEPRFKEDISDYIDVGVLNRSNTNSYSDIWKIPCYHWPYPCLQQKEIETAQDKYRADVSFSGNITKRDNPKHPHYGRTEFLEKIGKKLNLKIYPNEEISNSRFSTPVIAASSSVIIGTQLDDDSSGYIDVRCFQYIGAGALYFHEKCKSIEQFFQDGVHYVGYEHMNVDSFLFNYEHYVIERPEKGAMIREEGFNNCQENHNTMKRVKQALRWVGYE